MNAKGVGMQTWKALLNRKRKSLAGTQCSGRAGWNAEGDSQSILYVVVFVMSEGRFGRHRLEMEVWSGRLTCSHWYAFEGQVSRAAPRAQWLRNWRRALSSCTVEVVRWTGRSLDKSMLSVGFSS